MTATFVLGVCGGRDFADEALVFRTLDRVHAKRRAKTAAGRVPRADPLATALFGG